MMERKQSLLFEAFEQRGVRMRNRLVVSPMCQYSAEEGMANDWHLVHLGSRAAGGAGLVMVEATAVVAEGRISYGDMGLWNDGQAAPLARIAEFVKSQGAVAAIQLAHAGRKASTELPWKGGRAIAPGEPNGWQVVGAGETPFHEGDPRPHELTVAEIGGVVEAFAAAARRAVAAGYEVIEVHAAHGYLLHQFLSPLTNRRGDEYGGSLENRARAVREVVRAVRDAMPERLPLWLRVSATDWVEGGWGIDETVELARMVKGMGVDLIDTSSGGLVAGARIPVGPGYQVGFAERIRREAGMATGAVGLITTAEQAEGILRAGQADVVLMAREFLRDPYFAMRAARELGATVEAPAQYLRAIEGSVARV